MKKEKKKKILIISIILILIIIAIIILILFKFPKNTKKTQNENNISNNDSSSQDIKYNQNITKDKDINGILFTNINCSYDGYFSLLTYTITNNTNETINLNEYEIMIKDKNDNILAIITPNLNQEINSKESIDTGNTINIDLTGAYSMELIL